MLLLFMLTTLASASPVVVPGGSLVLPSQGNLLRSIMLPYYPTYPFTNWRLVPATSPVVIQIDVDYTCEKEGVFWNPEDCGSYFVCNDNGAGLKATKVNCPGSSANGNVLAFNNNTKTCDWASNVPGCGAERLITEPITIDIDFDYDCEAEGIFFNPEDCGSYVTCNSDNQGGIRAAKVDCAPTLVFNDELKVCDWPENVPDCALRTVASHPDGVKPSPEPVVACTQEVDGRITGPTPCVEPIIACADGSFRIDCDPISETWWWTAEEDPEDFDCSDKAMGVYEHPDQCNMYFVCTSEGRAFRHTCAEGTLFSTVAGECMFEEEVECKSRNEFKFSSTL